MYMTVHLPINIQISIALQGMQSINICFFNEILSRSLTLPCLPSQLLVNRRMQTYAAVDYVLLPGHVNTCLCITKLTCWSPMCTPVTHEHTWRDCPCLICFYFDSDKKYATKLYFRSIRRLLQSLSGSHEFSVSLSGDSVRLDGVRCVATNCHLNMPNGQHASPIFAEQ